MIEFQNTSHCAGTRLDNSTVNFVRFYASHVSLSTPHSLSNIYIYIYYIDMMYTRVLELKLGHGDHCIPGRRSIPRSFPPWPTQGSYLDFFLFSPILEIHFSLMLLALFLCFFFLFFRMKGFMI